MCGVEDRGTLKTGGQAVSCKGGITPAMAKHSDRAGFCRCPHSRGSTKKHQLHPQWAQTPGSEFSCYNWSPTLPCCCAGGKAIVYMQCLKQHMRSPCHVRKVRSNVTCQDPAWTSSLSMNSNFGFSQKSRQVPLKEPCAAGQREDISSRTPVFTFRLFS